MKIYGKCHKNLLQSKKPIKEFTIYNIFWFHVPYSECSTIVQPCDNVIFLYIFLVFFAGSFSFNEFVFHFWFFLIFLIIH